MQRRQILRQPNLIALSRPPDVAIHAAGEPLASIVDLNERLFALTAGGGHGSSLAGWRRLRLGALLLCYRPLQPVQYGVSSGWSGPAITFLSPSSVPGRLQRRLLVPGLYLRASVPASLNRASYSRTHDWLRFGGGLQLLSFAKPVKIVCYLARVLFHASVAKTMRPIPTSRSTNIKNARISIDPPV